MSSSFRAVEVRAFFVGREKVVGDETSLGPEVLRFGGIFEIGGWVDFLVVRFLIEFPKSTQW